MTYLELLEKKGLKLRYEQIQARKALGQRVRPPIVKNKLRVEMDDLIKKEMERRR